MGFFFHSEFIPLSISGQVPSTVPGTLKVFGVCYDQRTHSFTKSLLMVLNALLGARDIAMDLRHLRPLAFGEFTDGKSTCKQLNQNNSIGSNAMKGRNRQMREVTE